MFENKYVVWTLNDLKPSVSKWLHISVLLDGTAHYLLMFYWMPLLTVCGCSVWWQCSLFW